MDKYKQSGDIDFIVKQFDKQIFFELKQNFNDLKKCPSYWGKKLFISTINFNVYNWKIIQTEQYLLEKNKREGADMYKYMYQNVLEHKKQYDVS
tara:strand:+ start:421 stop:702 length:282 start_codon:yes stop_codon:yes gene_type:complete